MPLFNACITQRKQLKSSKTQEQKQQATQQRKRRGAVRVKQNFSCNYYCGPDETEPNVIMMKPIHACVTRRKQSKPSNTQDSKQQSIQQRTTQFMHVC